MIHNLIVAGFGGQGAIAMGKALVEAAVEQGMHTSWVPSYGAEVRGGVANCGCVISQEPITCPIVTKPNELVILNDLSFQRFVPAAVPGATIILNSSLISSPVPDAAANVYQVPADDIAGELGNTKTLNMVMLGAYLQVTGYLSDETVQRVLSQMFTGRKAHLIELNMRAVQAGRNCAANQFPG